jgi:cytoskeletal protein RodZ
MKQSPAISSEKMNNQKVFHLMFFFVLVLGLFFNTQAHQVAFGNESGQFLSETQISSAHSTTSETNSLESATVENEEKEEKEEKESESENDSLDFSHSGATKGSLISIVGRDLPNAFNVFEAYSKVKLYLLFHCLKSHLY